MSRITSEALNLTEDSERPQSPVGQPSPEVPPLPPHVTRGFHRTSHKRKRTLSQAMLGPMLVNTVGNFPSKILLLLSHTSPSKNTRKNTTMRNMKCARILLHNNFAMSTRTMRTIHISTQLKCLPIDLPYLVVFWILGLIVIFQQ